MSFFGDFFDNDELLWFIILFLLLFYCSRGYGGYGYGCAADAEK